MPEDTSKPELIKSYLEQFNLASQGIETEKLVALSLTDVKKKRLQKI